MTTRAFHFLADVEKILPEIKDKNPGQYYEIKAKVQTEIGLIEKAAENYELAKQAWRNYPSRYLRVLVSQADFEYYRRNYVKSKELLDSVLMLSSDSINTKERLDALWIYSYLHQKQGNLAEALNKSREFSKLKSTTYHFANARMLSEAKANYEFDRISGQLARQKLMSVKHQRNFYVAAAVAILLIVIIVSFFIYHLRMKKIHSVIVGNMRNSLKSEDVLKSRIRELEAKLVNNDEAPKKSAVVQDTLTEVMNDIETLFDKDRVYTDPGLTRDSLADLLGTNSTYITRAISERYHVSFVQFVNNYRIKEAVRVLSDPDDDTPIKAVGINVGYNSPTSFYNHFKEATGMTPAAYREAAHKSDNRVEESE